MKSVVRQLWEPNKIGGNLNTGKIKAKRKSHNKYICLPVSRGPSTRSTSFLGYVEKDIIDLFPFFA